MNDIFAQIVIISKELGVDPDLAMAIATVESNGNPLAVRFEPGWKYHFNTQYFASINGITNETERMLQACSWGPLQCMGSVCRELSYSGPLVGLTVSNLGIRYGVLKLKQLTNKYENEASLIASYNAGSPRKLPSGKFVNQGYVDQVQGRLVALRRLV